MPDPTIAEVHKTVLDMNGKMHRIIEGLYGPLDKPGTGFINETKAQLKSLDTNVTILLNDKKERKKDQKWTLRAAFTAVLGALAAIVKTFFFNGTGN